VPDRELWPRVSRALDAVYALEGEARAAELARLAGEDPAAHREVVALLDADPGTSRFFEDVGARAAEAVAAEVAPAPERVGDWRIVSPLGRGGMGEVFLAERADGAYEQRAALKLLKRGLDSDALVRRFLRERQILARLTHSGIARLLDGGVASDGRPFLVVEYVEGTPIDQDARDRRLGVPARLALLLEVCDAVEAAHRSLVVHRDLKPSNILVDAAGHAKLLDFGIAKLLAGGGEGEATRLDTQPFTRAYAAPEQILGGAVTTATDVYALGVILYELLTGERPFAREGRTPTELVHELETEHLEPPSAAAEERARAAPSRAERLRWTALARRLAGDLDAIVARALEPRSADRYPTVAAFAEDLRRHLDGRPVEARPTGWLYRTRKLVLRHRLGIAAGALVALSLVGGLAAALWQAARAGREARRAQRVQEFLVGMFESADPSQTIGANLTALQIVEQGVARIDREFAADPEVHAALLDVSARALRRVDRAAQALALAERSEKEHAERLGADAPATLLSALTHAEIETELGRLDSAVARLDDLLPRVDRAFAQGSPERLRVRESLAYALDEAGGFERSLALLGEVRAAIEAAGREETLDGARVHQELGAVLFALSRLGEAEAEYRRALALLDRLGARQSAAAAPVLSTLGEIQSALGRQADSLALEGEALSLARSVFGADSASIGRYLLPYGHQLSVLGRRAEARPIYEEAAAIFERMHHYNAAAALRYLGQDLMLEERFAEAREVFARALATARATGGDEHFMTYGALQALGDAETQLGHAAAGEAMLRQALAGFEKIFGPEGDFVRLPLRQLAVNLRRQGRLDDALALVRRVRAIEAKLYGGKPSNAEGPTLVELAIELTARGDAGALAEARGAIERAVGYLRSGASDTLRLGDALAASGRLAIAERDLERAARELGEAERLLAAGRAADAPSRAALRAELGRLGRRSA
jgi:serine/threonine-protein kinase